VKLPTMPLALADSLFYGKLISTICFSYKNSKKINYVNE
jgi:hypothetical protein